MELTKIKDKSYFYDIFNIDDLKELFEKYRGTGEFNYTKTGELVKYKEKIKLSITIGKVKSILSNQWEEAKGFTIHYSKYGVHLVPFIYED